jgi:DNA-binding HxlR family transcriptional regulator
MKAHYGCPVQATITYLLSRSGKKLGPLMEDLCRWGSKHFGIEPTLSRAS